MPSDRPVPVAPGALLTVCRRLLRPLVRLLIQCGVTLPVLNESLRTLYVDVATADILTDPKSRSDSRVSLITGIHRKEIRRLRDVTPEQPQIPEVVTVSSQVIARWLASPPYADASGRPRPLVRGAESAGSDPSFESLVASVTSDIRGRVVLDDWLSKGIVTTDEADRIVLNVDAFIPKPGADAQLFYFGRNLHDHVAAAVANIAAAETAPFLDRSVHYDGLTEEQAVELEAFARSEAIRLLLEVNRRAAALAEANPAQAPAARRVNFGVYVFTDTDQQTGPSEAGGGTRAA